MNTNIFEMKNTDRTAGFKLVTLAANRFNSKPKSDAIIQEFVFGIQNENRNDY